MIDHYAIYNEDMRSLLIEKIKGYRLPFVCDLQVKLPGATIDQYSYLFGVVYKRIADYTGHSVREVHQGYKELFGVEFSKNKDGFYRLWFKGVSGMNRIEIMDFALRVRADALLELGINIELPNEVFCNELLFKETDPFDYVKYLKLSYYE